MIGAEKPQATHHQRRKQQQFARHNHADIGHAAADAQAVKAAADHKQRQRRSGRSQHGRHFFRHRRHRNLAQGKHQRQQQRADNRVFQQIFHHPPKRGADFAAAAPGHINQNKHQRQHQNIFQQRIHRQITARLRPYHHRQERVADKARVRHAGGQAVERRERGILAAAAAQAPARKKCQQRSEPVAIKIIQIDYIAQRPCGDGVKHQHGQADADHKFADARQLHFGEKIKAHRKIAHRHNDENRHGNR